MTSNETSIAANQTKENWRSQNSRESNRCIFLNFFDRIISNEETPSANNMEELMALTEEEDEHNKGGNTSGGGRVKDKIEEDEE